MLDSEPGNDWNLGATTSGSVGCRSRWRVPGCCEHSQLPQEESVEIGVFVGNLLHGFAGAMAGLAFRAQQDGVLRSIGRLKLSDHLAGVGRVYPRVAFCRQK